MASTLPKKYGDVRFDKTKLSKHKLDLANDPPEPARSPSPFTEQIEKAIRKTFHTGRPMQDAITLVQCKTCKRPMVGHVSAPHIKSCVQKHKEKVQRKKEQKEANRKAREARDKEARAAEAEEAARALAEAEDDDMEDDGEGGKRPLGSKKRKAGDEGEKGPLKKKTKKELEALAAKDKKAAKPKGPVDVERQCGVPLAQGGFCARSLTCKSHPMGAKRGVPGRSKPYDVLLQQYQKKNQAKQQKAAIEANAEKEEDFVDPRGPVDSDEEKELVLGALTRWNPQPAFDDTPIPIRKRYQYLRVHDAFGQALRGSAQKANAAAAAAAAAAASTTTTGSVPNSGQGAGEESTAGGDDGRRQSAAGQRPAPLQSSSRKPSLASQAGMGTPTAATPSVEARA